MKILLDRYALTGPPRHGGMAEVYPAHDLERDARKVAVKILSRTNFEGEVLQEAYDREIRALRDLKHSNIVELIDCGKDPSNGSLFLILEWMETDLSVKWEEHRFAGWDSFFVEFGLPILQALEFAHRRQIIHRDLKPQNILLDSAGTPKLADFSISKLKKWLEPSLTLNAFASIPFAPPELDDGEYSYTRDVFGYAALCLQCLSAERLKTHADLFKALDNCDLPHDLFNILSRALSKNPADRHENATVLLANLETVQRARQIAWIRREDIYLTITGKALDKLRHEFPGKSKDEITRLIADDLNLVSGISSYDPKEPTSTEQFSLYGASFSLHVALQRNDIPQLVILSCNRLSSTLIEARRERSMPLTNKFVFATPEHSDKPSATLLTLRESLQEFTKNQALLEIQIKELELFRTWSTVLNAKTQIEKKKEHPIRYVRYSFDELQSRIRFELSEPASAELIGQQRIVNSDRERLITGEVEDVDGTTLTLYIDKLFSSDLPRMGFLTIDINAAKEALIRQKTALEDTRYDRALRSDLRKLLVHPENARTPEPILNIKYFQSDLDVAKQQAVQKALGSEDILLVQGPPGTGKTTFIAEVILQTLQHNPKTRILLTSQTHVALDNAVERLQALGVSFRIVRIGSGENSRISKSVYDLLIEKQIESWRAEVLEKGRVYLEEWAHQHGISRHQYSVSSLLRLLSSSTRKEQALCETERTLKARIAELRKEQLSTEVEEDIAVCEDDLKQTVTDYDKSKLTSANYRKRLVQLEPDALEIANSGPDELDSWAETYLPDTEWNRRFKQLIETHTEWESRLGRANDFQTALIFSSQVIAGTCIGIAGVKGIKDVEFDLCIVDEASKATPTETLVPMSRARRWIIVGDSKQLSPFVDEGFNDEEALKGFGLSKNKLTETLFDRLEMLLPNDCRTALTIQHRMVPPIGNLVSHCFYDGILKSAVKEWDPVFASILPKPVVWMTTSSFESRREQYSSLTYTNHFEAKFIAELLARLDNLFSTHSTGISVLVLTGYSGQKHLLERALAKLSLKNLRVECNTVDAVQGREAFLTLYCVTRSNESGRLGFLAEFRRLNVALSRGRQYLVVVGDHSFARSIATENPFSRIIDYIEEHPLDCAIVDVKKK